MRSPSGMSGLPGLSFLTQRKMSTQVLVAILTAAVALVVVGVVGLRGMGMLTSEADALYAQHTVGVTRLAEVRDEVTTDRMLSFRHSVAQNPDQMTDLEAQMVVQRGRYDEAVAAYRELLGPEDREAEVLLAEF
jgi:hypothetical protein